MTISAYMRLMRLHQPTGTLLLWFPTAWALWLANAGAPPAYLLALFFAGTCLMRAAGCVMNDMADSQLDKQVRRTHMRPLASGELTHRQACFLLFVLLSMAFGIVLCLPLACIGLALFAVLISLIYPFGKRFLQAPQLVLGCAFSLGIPMAYLASGVPWSPKASVLFMINFLWILAYDTLYALIDKPCDLQIGVQSTAILFGGAVLPIVRVLLLSMHALWFIVARAYALSWVFMIFWGLALLVIGLQWQWMQKGPESAFRAFHGSVWYGAIMWFGCIMG